MPQITIRLYGYLATIAGIRETSLSFPVLPTVKHVAEHLGIPHTEIDVILVNNNLAGFETIPHDGDRIAFYPRWHHLNVSHLQENN
ncbi:MAG: MoaD/ThiS family protein, partial [Brevinematales bacterium]